MASDNDSPDAAPRQPRRPRYPPAPAPGSASGSASRSPSPDPKPARRTAPNPEPPRPSAPTSQPASRRARTARAPAPTLPPTRRRLRITRRRVLLAILALAAGWLALSLALFLISAQFNRTSLPGDVNAVLTRGGFPLTSATDILVLGSDRRPKNSREPGAETSGPGRSDTIMLIRTGGGHAQRLSIPRDTVVEIPNHGLQKINAAHAFGGPALSVSVIQHWLHVPINHVVEVNFENFPQLIDAMGGVDYTGGCIYTRLDGGSSNGGFTLRLPAGAHHLNGRQALAIARTRENLCAPNQTDLNREEHQQALFQDMKSRLFSPSSFFRLPWIAWSAPPTIVSDMSGPDLLALFAALATGPTPPTRVLRPSGAITLPDGEEGLTVSEAQRRAAVARFMAG
jgi:LCP family protein required for cell wall assembly